MNYKITVFTPTYNRAHCLHRVYDSINRQTLKMIDDQYIFEWVIVDDGSNDNTKEIIQKWQKDSSFEIVYYYQKNQGKPIASRKGIELARGELFLFADSDDEFLPETFSVFYKQWISLTEVEQEKLGGIGVLCQDQFGNRIGSNYPIENKLLPSVDIVFKYRNIDLGETWAILKTKNLKKAFVIPKEAQHLKFIPETFFWDRITFELKQYSYFINKVLRIYYIDESDSISSNVRVRYPEGFLFESQWFINHYKFVLLKSPTTYLKHLIKYTIFSLNTNKTYYEMLQSLDGIILKSLFVFFILPSKILKRKYLKGDI